MTNLHHREKDAIAKHNKQKGGPPFDGVFLQKRDVPMDLEAFVTCQRTHNAFRHSNCDPKETCPPCRICRGTQKGLAL